MQPTPRPSNAGVAHRCSTMPSVASLHVATPAKNISQAIAGTARTMPADGMRSRRSRCCSFSPPRSHPPGRYVPVVVGRSPQQVGQQQLPQNMPRNHVHLQFVPPSSKSPEWKAAPVLLGSQSLPHKSPRDDATGTGAQRYTQPGLQPAMSWAGHVQAAPSVQQDAHRSLAQTIRSLSAAANAAAAGAAMLRDWRLSADTGKTSAEAAGDADTNGIGQPLETGHEQQDTLPVEPQIAVGSELTTQPAEVAADQPTEFNECSRWEESPAPHSPSLHETGPAELEELRAGLKQLEYSLSLQEPGCSSLAQARSALALAWRGLAALERCGL